MFVKWKDSSMSFSISDEGKKLFELICESEKELGEGCMQYCYNSWDFENNDFISADMEITFPDIIVQGKNSNDIFIMKKQMIYSIKNAIIYIDRVYPKVISPALNNDLKRVIGECSWTGNGDIVINHCEKK